MSKCPADASLYAARRPPTRVKAGRARQGRGNFTHAPGGWWRSRRQQRLNVAWYGGGRREGEVVTGTRHWYRAGRGLVAVRWVYVHDGTGHAPGWILQRVRDQDSCKAIIEEYTGRWTIEATFEDVAAATLGLESTRGWCTQLRTVGRAEPCLLGLYSVVALLYWLLPEQDQEQGVVQWEGKQTVTFSDAMTAVRRWLWTHWVFPRAGHAECLCKTPRASFSAVPAIRPRPHCLTTDARLATLRIAAKVKLRAFGRKGV